MPPSMIPDLPHTWQLLRFWAGYPKLRPQFQCPLWGSLVQLYSGGLSPHPTGLDWGCKGPHIKPPSGLRLCTPALDPNATHYPEIPAFFLPFLHCSGMRAQCSQAPRGWPGNWLCFLPQGLTIPAAQQPGCLPSCCGQGGHSLCPQKPVGRGRAQACEGGGVGSSLRVRLCSLRRLTSTSASTPCSLLGIGVEACLSQGSPVWEGGGHR